MQRPLVSSRKEKEINAPNEINNVLKVASQYHIAGIDLA